MIKSVAVVRLKKLGEEDEESEAGEAVGGAKGGGGYSPAPQRPRMRGERILAANLYPQEGKD
jgi:hypothetical protein